MRALGGLLIFCCVGHLSLALESPASVAQRVADEIVSFRHACPFLDWDYGGALIFDGLWRISDTIPELRTRYVDVLDGRLLNLTTSRLSPGHYILRNITLPFGNAVGDFIGLFPIAYLAQATYNRHWRPSLDNATDLAIATRVADHYILGWPKRLPDNTFSRDKGWPGEQDGNHTFLWGDDQLTTPLHREEDTQRCFVHFFLFFFCRYMGLVLMARLLRISRNNAYLASVSTMPQHFTQYFVDPADGLYSHGYNHLDQHRSCCKWGRANGWGLMSHVEMLETLEMYPEANATVAQLKDIFVAHARAVVQWQIPDDGRFHQLVNETDTFAETSVTAMVISSLARGVLQGHLSPSEFDEPLRRAWAGLLRHAIDPDGSVQFICDGTGIQSSKDGYMNRPQSYCRSANGGLGAVLSAIVDMYSYEQKFGA